MSYEEAFTALKNGDLKTAVPLLEQAACDTGYTSDMLNHALTLALYRAGAKLRLAEVAFRIGNSLLTTDAASAMDYFQRALVAGLDTPSTRRIGEIFEGWAAPQRNGRIRPPVTRVAHVVGCMDPDHPPSQYVKVLAASLREQGVESSVFTTEWAASWFFNPQNVPLSQTPGMDSETVVASVEGDFLERAGRIAAAVQASNIPVAFYHSSLAEQITARVAALRPAPIQINVNHGIEMDADLFDGAVHLYSNALKRTRYPERPAQWIPPASDVRQRLHAGRPLTRQSLGLEAAGSVSATFGSLVNASGDGFLNVLCEVLKRCPGHFHIFAGTGDVKGMRARLHSEGVLPHIRFLGAISDVGPLLETVDVYLSSFPDSGESSLLEAMAAGKPVVVLRYPLDSHYSAGAELVGIPELIAANQVEYIELAHRLIRDTGFRLKYSVAVGDRFLAQFQPAMLGSRYIKFLEEF